MIFLNNSTRSLEVILGGAKTTNDCNCVSAYTDSLGFAINAITTNTVNTNGGTAVTLVAAPTGTNIQSGTLRIIKSFSVYNADTVATTVTIRMNDNGTFYTIVKVTLATLENLIYEDANGFNVLDVNGNIKLNIPAGSITLAGDVSGAANANTVGKINGVGLGSTTATSGNILIANGSQWITNAVSGAITMTSGGVTTLGSVTPSAISFLSNKSATKTPAASGNWNSGSATITLTSGTWVVYGATFFFNGGTSPQYGQFSYVLATADGANSASEPAAVATSGNVTLKAGQVDGRGITNSTSDLFGNAGGATVNNFSGLLTMEPVLIAVSASTAIFLVPFAILGGSASNARIITDLWALKVSTATS